MFVSIRLIQNLIHPNVSTSADPAGWMKGHGSDAAGHSACKDSVIVFILSV